jgi:hypothetical protein
LWEDGTYGFARSLHGGVILPKEIEKVKSLVIEIKISISLELSKLLDFVTFFDV